MAVPRVNSLVTTTDAFVKATTSWPNFEPDYGYDPRFLFLGEIPNNPGKCAVVWLKKNTVIIKSTEYFRELSKEELERVYD